MIITKYLPALKGVRTKFYEHIDRFIAGTFPKYWSGILYKRTFGKSINWQSPEDLNQWLHRLTFEKDSRLYPILADKYRVRDYLKSLGVQNYLIPILSVWDNEQDINLNEIDRPCVIKANNGSGDHMFIKNPTLINEVQLKEKIKLWRKKEFGKMTAEPFYRKVPFKVVVEEMLDLKKQDFESSSMIDYKIWCFYGEPYIICIYYDRNDSDSLSKTKLEIRDVNWNDRNDLVNAGGEFVCGDGRVIKPKKFSTLLKLASILSKNLVQARVDFYITNNKIYFGEITLKSHCGLMTSLTQEGLKELGSKISERYEK